MEGNKVFINKKHATIIGALLLLCVLVFYFSLPNYYQFGDEKPTISVVQQPEQQPEPMQHNQVGGNYTNPVLANVGIDMFGMFGSLIQLMLMIGFLGIIMFVMSSMMRLVGRNRW